MSEDGDEMRGVTKVGPSGKGLAMRGILKRMLGIVRMIVSAGSLLLALSALVLVWRARQPLANGLAAGAQVLVDTLDTTGKALVVTEQALQATADNVDVLQRAVLTIARAIDDVRPTVASVTRLIGQNLIISIERARGTLASAASGARLIDDLLSSLSQIPLFNLNYNPETPLSVSLHHVASSLDDLPPALNSLAADLSGAESNLGQVSGQIMALAAEVGRIKASVVAAEEVVVEYQAKVARVRSTVEWLRARSEVIVTLGAVVATFLIYWLMVAQLREFIAGLSWLRKG